VNPGRVAARRGLLVLGPLLAASGIVVWFRDLRT